MGAFSAFWTTLTFHLANLPAHYGSETAGLFGLVGRGRSPGCRRGRSDRRPRRTPATQRRGPPADRPLLRADGDVRPVARSPCRSASSSWTQACRPATSPTRRASTPLSAEMRNRLNGVYMVIYFLGGATGSAFGSHAWERFGWPAFAPSGPLWGAAGLVALFTRWQSADRPASSSVEQHQLLDVAVQSAREEPALGCLVTAVNDVEHLTRTPGKREAVAIGRARCSGCRRNWSRPGLYPFCRRRRACPGGRTPFALWSAASVPALKDRQTQRGIMVSLDGQDARRPLERRLVREQRTAAEVGGHANIGQREAAEV